jgi:protein-L-isoaspartate(D-aspartate) O-methyltransferase
MTSSPGSLPAPRPASHSLQLLVVVVAAIAVVALFPAAQTGSDDFRQQREAMVRQQMTIPRGPDADPVRDPAVLQAFRDVPRHRFVPETLAEHAYADRALPIGYDQTISQPYVVAKMTEVVQPKKHHRVLEIGTGSGYQAAILSRLVAQVYSIEIVEPLGLAARARLQELGYSNVEVRIGDGYQGWPEQAPFDSIVVTAGATRIPPALVEQLKPGGRMVIPVGSVPDAQRLLLVTKDEHDPRDIRVEEMMAVRFVPLVRRDE